MTNEQDRPRSESGGVTGPEPIPGLPANQPADQAEPVPADGAAPPGEAVSAEPEPPAAAPAESPEVEPPSQPPGRRAGRVRHQDPETATPRAATLAEQRAHQQAARREVDEEEARLAEEARKRKTRKRVMIGGAATAGVVALVAIGYAVSQPDEVEAKCVDNETGVIADDSNCVQPATNTANSGYYGGGVGFIPIFLGGGGRQYSYNYGGSGSVGQVATGGTSVAPKNATVRTSSGRTIQRGGFGVSRSGSSGGSKAGSGSSGS